MDTISTSVVLLPKYTEPIYIIYIPLPRISDGDGGWLWPRFALDGRSQNFTSVSGTTQRVQLPLKVAKRQRPTRLVNTKSNDAKRALDMGCLVFLNNSSQVRDKQDTALQNDNRLLPIQNAFITTCLI